MATEFQQYSQISAFITFMILVVSLILYRRMKGRQDVASQLNRFTRNQLQFFTDIGFTNEYFCDKFIESFKKYGDGLRHVKNYFTQHPKGRGKVCPFSGAPTVFFCEPNIARQFLDKAHYYIKEKTQSSHLTLLAKGLLFSEGNDWKRKRILYTEYFTTERIGSLVTKMQEYAQKYMHEGTVEDEKTPLNYCDPEDFYTRIEKITDSIIFYIFMGDSFKDLKVFDLPLGQAIMHVVKGVLEGAEQAKVSKIVDNKQSVLNILELKSAIENRIVQSYSQKQPQQPGTLLELLKQKGFEADADGLQDLSEDLISFIFAGRDTTSHLIYMALYYLARSASEANTDKTLIDVQQKVYQEIIDTKGDVSKMPYLEQVLYETLRIYGPTVSLFLRKCSELNKLGDDIIVRPGTIAGIGVVEMHHDPKVWKDPFKFDPERFNDTQATQKLFAFSHGPRSCMGQKLAMAEAKVVITSVLKRYILTLEASQLKSPPKMTVKQQYCPESAVKFEYSERVQIE